MPKSFCNKCQKGFDFDHELGVNIKHFEAASDRNGFYGGGIFPCCPACGDRCCEQKPGYVNVVIKQSWIPFNEIDIEAVKRKQGPLIIGPANEGRSASIRAISELCGKQPHVIDSGTAHLPGDIMNDFARLSRSGQISKAQVEKFKSYFDAFDLDLKPKAIKPEAEPKPIYKRTRKNKRKRYGFK